MSEEEEASYFEINHEPIPKELPPKTVTFIINPTLTDIWERLGYKDTDIAIEVNKLDIALTRTYLEFMAETASRFDELNHKIHDHKKEFQKLKKVYGDKTAKLEVSDHLPLVEQENLTNKEIEKLNKKYAPRLELLKKLVWKCKNHFDRLGIDEEARGDYNELGDTDYTQERVERFKNMLVSLKREESNRANIYNSCAKSIRSISEELEEPLSDQVTFILANELVDTDSINALTQASEDLTSLKMKRYKEYDALVQKLQHLYSILRIEPEEQIKIPNKPTKSAFDLVRAEVYKREQYKEENRDMLIDQFQEEIEKICDEMKVPFKLRPKYYGNDPNEKLDFLESTLESTRERLAKTQPIIEILGQIEEIKSRNSPMKEETSNPNISQQLVKQKNQERINAEVKPLERNLLTLLLQFRKDNGFDFQFEGVTYIDTLSQTFLADDIDKFGATVLEHKTPETKKKKIPATAPRNTNYMSPKSPKKYVSKQSPYTPRKRILFDE